MTNVESPYRAVSMEDAAGMACIAVSTLYSKVKAGTGPRVTKLGARTVVLISDFESWMEAQRAATGVLKPIVVRKKVA